MAQAVTAAGQGTAAASATNTDLIVEDTRLAVSAYREQFAPSSQPGG